MVKHNFKKNLKSYNKQNLPAALFVSHTSQVGARNNPEYRKDNIFYSFLSFSGYSLEFCVSFREHVQAWVELIYCISDSED